MTLLSARLKNSPPVGTIFFKWDHTLPHNSPPFALLYTLFNNTHPHKTVVVIGRLHTKIWPLHFLSMLCDSYGALTAECLVHREILTFKDSVRLTCKWSGQKKKWFSPQCELYRRPLTNASNGKIPLNWSYLRFPRRFDGYFREIVLVRDVSRYAKLSACRRRELDEPLHNKYLRIETSISVKLLRIYAFTIIHQ